MDQTMKMMRAALTTPTRFKTVNTVNTMTLEMRNMQTPQQVLRAARARTGLGSIGCICWHDMKMDEDEGVQQEQARHVCKSCYDPSYQVMPSFLQSSFNWSCLFSEIHTSSGGGRKTGCYSELQEMPTVFLDILVALVWTSCQTVSRNCILSSLIYINPYQLLYCS